MADVKIAVARFALNTSIGNQSVTTTDLGGKTPKGVFFIVAKGVTDGTVRDGAGIGMGAASATTERWACGRQDQDAVAAVNTNHNEMQDMCIHLRKDDASGIDGEADFVSFDTNGCTINVTTGFAAAYLCTAIFFAGDDVECHAGVLDPGNAVDDTLDVTAPGFQPDFVFFDNPKDTYNGSAGGSSLGHQFGIAIRDGSDTQQTITQQDHDTQATGDPASQYITIYGAGHVTRSAGALGASCLIGSFDSSGFTATTKEDVFSGGQMIAYFAVRVGGLSVSLNTLDTPTSTGNNSSVLPNFKPQFVLLGLTHLQAVDTGTQSADAGTHGMGVFTEDAEFSNTIAIEDNAATTNTQSLCDDTAVNLPQDDGVASIVASHVSMDSTGYTLNFTTANANARKWMEFAIQTDAADESSGKIFGGTIYEDLPWEV